MTPAVKAETVRYKTDGEISVLKSAMDNPQNTIKSVQTVRNSRSFFAPKNFLEKTLNIMFTAKRLPDVFGFYLLFFKFFLNFSAIQYKYTIGRQRNAFQDVRRK